MMMEDDVTNSLNVFYVGNGDYPYKKATIKDCVDYLKDKKVISLDIETTRKYGGKYQGEGLDPYLSEIVMVQIGDLNRQYVIDYRTFNDLKLLHALLTSNSVTIVGQNLKFEYLHFLHNEGIRLENLYDTMVVEQILFNGLNPDSSLLKLVQKYLNINIEKDTRLEFLTIKDKPFTKTQIEYGAADILYPLLIREKQLRLIQKKNVRNCVSLEMLFIPVLGDIQYKGMNFNKKIWTDTYNKNLIKLNELHSKLNSFVIDNFGDSIFIDKQLDLFSTEKKCLINWGSSKQVIEFFRFLDICPQAVSKSTKLLSYTVNKVVLKSSLNTINRNVEEYKKQLLKDYIDYKETEQSTSTFGLQFFKYINPITNRLHSNYKQILNTGRISSSGPNLQNIPALNEFRSAFRADDGYVIVNADYSGQEQIILANKSNDKDLIYFYEQNLGDMHSYIASKIFPELHGIPLKEIKQHYADLRQIAKAAGFAINYGGNGHTIAKNLGVSDSQGEEVYIAYFKAFPNLKKYFDKVQKQSLKQGYILIDPITNRKNWFRPPTNKKEKGSIERAALNFPIQGEAGGITKFAPILFRRWILENNYQNDIFITNIVHDEINLEVKKEFAALAANNLELCMKKAGDKWCKTIPLTASAVITDYWNH